MADEPIISIKKKSLLYVLLWYAEQKSLCYSCILPKHGQIWKGNVLTCYQVNGLSTKIGAEKLLFMAKFHTSENVDFILSLLNT